MTGKKSPRAPRQVTGQTSRYYELADGTRLPSVTTILGVALNKPALVGWAAKTVAAEAMAYLPKLNEMSRRDKEAAIRWLKGRPYAERDEAAGAGTAAHDLAEAHALGKPYDRPDESTDLGRTLARFRRWIADFDPTFEATEAVVVNRAVGYAGSLDAIVRVPALDNRLLVIDYKTSKSGPYPEWALQVAAYARAEELWLPDGTSVPMPKIEGAAVLRLRPTLYALHEVVADLDDLHRTFSHAVRLAEWAQDAGLKVGDPFGPPVVAQPTLESA